MKVKLWRFRIRSKYGRVKFVRYIWAPTRHLAILAFNKLYPRYWGFAATIWRVPDNKTDRMQNPFDEGKEVRQ